MTTPLLKSDSNRDIPYIPVQAPFTPEQRAWLNGYLAGMFSRAVQDGPTEKLTTSPPPPKPTLHILYGSQSGTAEGIAKDLARQAASKGFEPVVIELNEFEKMDRSKPQTALIVTSTWGEGEPPDNALTFWNSIQQSEASDWKNVSYSVLALGDSNYSDFCGAGKLFDARLEALGARRILDRVDCDVDDETPSEDWMQRIWGALEAASTSTSSLHGTSNNAPSANQTQTPTEPDSEAAGHATTYDRKRPFSAKFIRQQKLNQTGSAKDTRHIEICLEGSGLTYRAGDALGIYPSNDPELVRLILDKTGLKTDMPVRSKDTSEKTLFDALTFDCQLNKINPRLLAGLFALEGMSAKEPPKEVTDGMDLLDVLPPGTHLNGQALVDLLPKLQPRLYSIASSPFQHPDNVHLTVGVVRFECAGRWRHGVCSSFLADRLSPPDTLPVFIHPSSFKLPEQTDQSIIMVGPGTGIAPFRGFLQERKAAGGSGKNWLFFGDQKAATDFLYQDELKAFQSEGVLHRFHTAFSRDQAQKIYVQDRMQEQASELWKWLEDGASFYVCGDAKRMAKDVDKTLHQIVSEQGGMTQDQAKAYVENMKKEKRYQRDVY